MKLAVISSAVLILFGVWATGSLRAAPTVMSEATFANYVSSVSIGLQLGTPIAMR